MTDVNSFAERPILKKAAWLKSQRLYPFFRSIEEFDGPSVKIGGQKQIMVSSNNYLGLTHHPYVQEAAKKAIEKYGTGCTGSRFLNGTLVIHEELEERLAKFVGHESALVFSTGMQVNLGVVPSLCGPKDCALYDMENHASLIDAARLSFGQIFKYKHSNMEELEDLLCEKEHQFRVKTVVTDGVFSMTGEISKLPKIVELCKRYNALLYLDDAHGTGVLGPNGRGTGHHFNLMNEVDVYMGTFSKSFASIGGFVSGPKDIVSYIKYTARTFMFTAALPPAAVATVLACLDLLEKDEHILKSLWENVHFMKKGLTELGLYKIDSQTPIIPIFVGDDELAMRVTMELQDQGVFATPVVGPAVPPGSALIRTSYMATHTRPDLEYCLDSLEKVSKKYDLSSRLVMH